MTWIEDSNGNKCSVEYWGSREAAQKALDSLINCKNCTNCSGCSDCSGCSGCSRCSGCSGCSRCSGCSGCSDCSGCSRCSDCSDCSDCSGCSRCSDCSDCSDCSGCSRCSRCSGCSDKNDVKAENQKLGPPPVPIIPDIHTAVYAASSHPGSLAMESVHKCADTHCRAGWVITLAGDAGRKLEEFFNWELAAMKIYEASDPGFKINPSRFYDNNHDALLDMKALAERDAK